MPRNLKTFGIQAPPRNGAVGVLPNEMTPVVPAPPSELTVGVEAATRFSFGKPLGALISASALRPYPKFVHAALRQAKTIRVGASCALARSWSSLTPNQSFQPTSHSSLRSSRAAAELSR